MICSELPSFPSPLFISLFLEKLSPFLFHISFLLEIPAKWASKPHSVGSCTFTICLLAGVEMLSSKPGGSLCTARNWGCQCSGVTPHGCRGGRKNACKATHAQIQPPEGAGTFQPQRGAAYRSSEEAHQRPAGMTERSPRARSVRTSTRTTYYIPTRNKVQIRCATPPPRVN